ncbi:putative carbohydrate sulfotransferase 9 [Penaeus vannamei]|uniref:Carbohydrate sulfotransferase n=1 Tax=Penaeus vannamei TaxID=6689 RepID=A0A423THI5_PENVA|nr:putative carbohydrate sulfotransferase 9 [Penaeus vannamei]
MPKRPYSYCPRYKTHIYILFLLRRRLPPPLRALRKRVFARRFQEREEFKKEMCRKMNTSGKILTNYFMYYNKEYKLLLCAPPKTGCSSLKRHLLRLVGFPENINVHSDQARRAIAVRQVLGDDLQEVLQSTFPSTRAMVARDPLDRIVSGYKDKFRNGDQVTGMWANYMTRYRMRRGFNTSNMTITFDQYLEMIANIMETYGRNSIDRHFRATSLLCSPCSVDYEYILHTDTLTQDLQYIVEQLNITDIDLGLLVRMALGAVPRSFKLHSSAGATTALLPLFPGPDPGPSQGFPAPKSSHTLLFIAKPSRRTHLSLDGGHPRGRSKDREPFITFPSPNFSSVVKGWVSL